MERGIEKGDSGGQVIGICWYSYTGGTISRVKFFQFQSMDAGESGPFIVDANERGANQNVKDISLHFIFISIKERNVRKCKVYMT